MRWDEFTVAAPELAGLGEERLRDRELCLLGTLRKNGYPRISPVEPEFVDGELMLGLMWQSPKALDLLRDPRCVVHSVVSDRAGTEGDFKLYGKAVPVEDPQVRPATARRSRRGSTGSRRSRTTTCLRSMSSPPGSSSSARTGTDSRGIPSVAYAAGAKRVLEVPAQRLLALDRREEGLEVALAEGRGAVALDHLEEHRRPVLRGLREDLQQIAVLVAVGQDLQPL